MTCKYTADNGHNVTTVFWYLKAISGEEPEDISLDPRFQGRVEYLGDKEQDCGLRISDARENDSGTYDFLFKTNMNEGSQTSESGVQVTVTALLSCELQDSWTDSQPDFIVLLPEWSLSATLPATTSPSAYPAEISSSRCGLSHWARKLHWLPIPQRIQFKVLLFTYKALPNQAPSYLTDLLHHHTPFRSLRSSDAKLLSVLSMKDVLTEGDWLILSCGNCIPTSFIPTYVWKKDGRPHATKQGNNILEMESVKMEDGGEYSCSKVKAQLDEVLNTLERKSDKSSKSENLASRATTILNISETLVSLLVKPTDTEELLNFTSNTTEVKVYTVGPNATLKNVLRLNNTAALMDIDIISIAKNNKGHASVAFMTYDNMSEILKPTFFPSKKGTVNTMMSTVVSASLPKTTNKMLINPVNFTLKHIRETDPTGTLYCVYWDKTEWSTNGCVRIREENSNDTICSCTHLSTFALLMQTEKLPEWSHRLELLSTIAVTVGLIFLSLAVFTFILFRKNSRVSSVLRLNLCICLLLAHLLFLLTQRFLAHSSYKVACAVFAGILHFLFLSAFMWMFLEAITLFISVKNLSKIKSRRREVLHWKYQLVIGYVVPTLVVGVSAAVVRDSYDSEACWIKLGTSFVWSFLGPVCFILTVNLILFITIIITLQCTLMHLSGDVSQIKNSRTMVFKALAQFFILGCPWILGFSIKHGEGVEIIFLLLISQQGTFIFLVHCVLSEEVRKQYKKLWYTLCPHHEFGSSEHEQMTEVSDIG
ncbi:adhesion G protein-coupled receptor E3-like [Chanos chanos]|uniref:Adhesion G protein-coupled receptor E3-like n=1 Tax=Chanos chanos TaxID=29144 RepID=A0A6J2VP53_CHACN|nr:adhesion G protein-coupled receptor E3-like [Chanos chanos]